MLISMTAFARASEATEWGLLTCELRSVNHRYLEISPRITEELRYLEPKVRELLSDLLKRGRVDCYLRIQGHEDGQRDFQLDRELLDRVAALSGDLKDGYPQLEPMSVADLLSWPGVVQSADIDSDRLERLALGLVQSTCDRLYQDRAREGKELAAVVMSRVADAEAAVEQLKQRMPELVQAHRDRIAERLQAVRSELDPERLEQELVLYAQKSDVAEELDRLSIHLKEVRQVIEGGGAVGRRLDFLMQELNREANTLGAKAFDAAMSQCSVDLKVCIDQMREQIQNVE